MTIAASPSGAQAARDRRVELAIAIVPVLLAAVSILTLVDPGIAPATVNVSLDLVLNAAATLVAVSVAALGWVHFREGGDPAALLRASAFLVLATLNALVLGAVVSGVGTAFGLSLADPGQLPLWAVTLARAVAAVLLMGAGVAALRHRSLEGSPAALVLWLPAVLVAGVIVLAAITQDALLPLLSNADLQRLQANPTQPLVLQGAYAFGLAQVVIGIGYLAAAALSYRLYQRSHLGTEALFTVGLVLAAFSQVQAAIHPGTYLSLVTAGDLLRVAFYAVMLLTVAAQSRADVRDLRHAHAELVGLRDAELARATAEERARLAREIHDGMSQELWFAKLKQARLTSLADLPEDARGLATEVAFAIESALAEARQAIAALRPAEGATFAQVVERYLEDFSDRFGIRAESACDPLAERIPARAQAELLRVIQEALNNARKHADPTLVRVDVASSNGGLRVTITDNGRGFEPEVIGESGYGLQSMRERAAVIGASLLVDSQPHDGTRIVVELPLAGRPA